MPGSLQPLSAETQARRHTPTRRFLRRFARHRLGVIGLGVQEPMPSWGSMVQLAMSLPVLENMLWRWMPPAGMIAITVKRFPVTGVKKPFRPLLTVLTRRRAGSRKTTWPIWWASRCAGVSTSGKRSCTPSGLATDHAQDKDSYHDTAATRMGTASHWGVTKAAASTGRAQGQSISNG